MWISPSTPDTISAKAPNVTTFVMRPVTTSFWLHSSITFCHGIGLGLLKPERDALTIAIDVEHLDVHLLADLEDLGRMVDVAPGELGDVDQTVDAVEIDERAEVDDVRDHAFDLDARRQPVEDLLALLLALLLEHRAAREHDVVAAAVELDHLAAQRLVAVLLEILHPADVDQRRRQEAAHARGR